MLLFQWCTGFAFKQIQLILAPTLFNFNYCLSLGLNIRYCGSALDESERSILGCFSQQAALPSLNAVIHVRLLTPGKVKTFQITLKESLPTASTCFQIWGKGVCLYKRRRKDLGVPYFHHSCLVPCLLKKTP